MTYDLIVRGGSVVTPEGTQAADIGISDGRFAAIADEISDGGSDAEIDARGLTVFPGMVDAHVHFNDPGRDAWEGAATGSAALAAGGGTVFVDMPLNSSPPTLDAESFDAKANTIAGRSHTDYALYGGLTPTNLDDMEALAEKGVAGFKAFMVPSGIDDFQFADDVTLLRGMEIAAALNLPVLLHAESLAITGRLGADLVDPLTGANGATVSEEEAIGAFLESRPIVSELEAISRALLFGRETGCKVHIVHVSNARGIRLVRDAVAAGTVDATCETCPHYLYLNTDDLLAIRTPAKCAPPLRPESERQGLLEQVLAGNVDTIGSDHSPAPESMKSGSFLDAWGGIPGVQSLLRVLLSLEIPHEAIASMAAARPAERFGLPDKGAITVGNDADLAIVDTGAESELTREELRDRHRLSPYVGRKLRGRVQAVLLRGVVVGDQPRGQLLRPAR